MQKSHKILLAVAIAILLLCLLGTTSVGGFVYYYVNKSDTGEADEPEEPEGTEDEEEAESDTPKPANKRILAYKHGGNYISGGDLYIWDLDSSDAKAHKANITEKIGDIVGWSKDHKYLVVTTVEETPNTIKEKVGVYDLATDKLSEHDINETVIDGQINSLGELVIGRFVNQSSEYIVRYYSIPDMQLKQTLSLKDTKIFQMAWAPLISEDKRWMVGESAPEDSRPILHDFQTKQDNDFLKLVGINYSNGEYMRGFSGWYKNEVYYMTNSSLLKYNPETKQKTQLNHFGDSHYIVHFQVRGENLYYVVVKESRDSARNNRYEVVKTNLNTKETTIYTELNAFTEGYTGVSSLEVARAEDMMFFSTSKGVYSMKTANSEITPVCLGTCYMPRLTN